MNDISIEEINKLTERTNEQIDVLNALLEKLARDRKKKSKEMNKVRSRRIIAKDRKKIRKEIINCYKSITELEIGLSILEKNKAAFENLSNSYLIELKTIEHYIDLGTKTIDVLEKEKKEFINKSPEEVQKIMKDLEKEPKTLPKKSSAKKTTAKTLPKKKTTAKPKTVKKTNTKK